MCSCLPLPNSLGFGQLAKNFEPFLKPRHSVNNTNRSQAIALVLEVTHFASSENKSTMHLTLAWLTMLRIFGKICLMMYVQSLPLLVQKEVENIPTQVSDFFPIFLCGAMSLVICLWIFDILYILSHPSPKTIKCNMGINIYYS